MAEQLADCRLVGVELEILREVIGDRVVGAELIFDDDKPLLSEDVRDFIRGTQA